MATLTLVRRIAARPQVVFDAFIEPQAIAQWWGPDAGPVLVAEVDARIGGRFRVRFRMLDGGEHEACGEYLEIARPTRLVMSWRWASGGEGDEGRDESRVEVDLRPVEGGTELTFTHALLRTEASRAGHEEGWSGALDKLERYISSMPAQAS